MGATFDALATHPAFHGAVPQFDGTTLNAMLSASPQPHTPPTTLTDVLTQGFFDILQATPTPVDDPPQLPLFTNMIIFVLWATVASFIALWVCHYYGRKDMSLYVRVTCICSYIACFMSMYIISLDVTGGYKAELKYIWAIYYCLVSLGCWIIVPFSQSYNDNGGFNLKDKVIETILDEGVFYGVVLSVAAIILGFMYISYDFGSDVLLGLVMNLANTFGFIILTFFFGSGLVNFPLSIWTRANRPRQRKFMLYKLGKLNEKMQLEQDRLQQTNAYMEVLEDNCPDKYRELFEVIKSKLPPASAYEFAFIGLSNMIEAHGKLEDLQKMSFNDLKRHHFITLHYVVINHRRSLAMFQAEWREAVEAYNFLTHANDIIERHPTPKDWDPATEFIEPGEATYSNFPGSFLWTLPCFRGDRDYQGTAKEHEHLQQQLQQQQQQQQQDQENLRILGVPQTSSQNHTPIPDDLIPYNNHGGSDDNDDDDLSALEARDQVVISPPSAPKAMAINTATLHNSSGYPPGVIPTSPMAMNGEVKISIAGTPAITLTNRPLVSQSPYINNQRVILEDRSIYDDMTTTRARPLTRQMSTLGGAGGMGGTSDQSMDDQQDHHELSLHEKWGHVAQNMSTWLFRKSPPLIPGTLYYRLTVWWFTFVLYYQPTVQRILATICACFSLLLLWCEITIMVPQNLSPISYLAHIDGASVTTQTILRILPLPYIVACTYYTVYHVNLGWWFHMQTAHRTSIRSMLFSCSFMMRTIFTTTFNYYQMCRVKDTAFTDFVGPMAILPILGSTFNLIMPMFVVVFAFLTAINCWGTLLRCFGVPHFNFNMNDKESPLMIEDGKVLIQKDQAAKNGERVEHFRSREIDAQRLAQKREEKRRQEYKQQQIQAGGSGSLADYDTMVAGHRQESEAVRHIREKREREKLRKDADDYALRHDPHLKVVGQPSAAAPAAGAYPPAPTPTANYAGGTLNHNFAATPQPNPVATKTAKYHSQNQPKMDLDDF